MKLKQQIQGLKDEVRQFHPMLHRLFGAMPNVRRVIYTHGIDEMGADFVLERFDSDLASEESIGVVVKCGSISQGHADVDRQIEECRVRRLIDGEERYLNSVWVVCNGNISRNAQEKIRDKHNASNVKFISIDPLCSLVEKHLNGAIDDVPIRLQNYADQLRHTIDVAEKASELVPGLSSIYVEPEIFLLSEDSAGFYKKEKEIGSINGLKKHLKRNRLCLFEAKMGGGKSKAMRKLAVSLLDDDEFSSGSLIPILISAQGFVDIVATAEDWLAEVVPKELRHEGCEVYVLVDGLDEVGGDEDQISELLEIAFQTVHQNEGLRLLVSSRPVDRYTGALHSTFSKMDRLEIEALRGKRAISFLTEIADATSISERVIQDLSSNNLIRAFDSTPIAYILLGSLMNQQSKELPATVPDLFERYFGLVLERWEIEKGLLHQKESQVMFQGLEEVSGRMFESGSFQLAESEVVDIFRQYISERDISGVSPEEVVDKLCKRCMVLYRGAAGTLSFRHRTFAEYFQARLWLRRGERELDYSAFFYSNVTSAYFFVGSLKDCPKVLGDLACMELPGEVLRFNRMVHFGNMLQAAYTTPSHCRRESLKQVIQDSAKLYFEICDGGVDTPLAKLSRIHLLGFFRNVIVGCYSYSDFAKHAEWIASQLLDGEKNRENALAIFFLVLIKAEHDNDLDFAKLIDEYGADIPIEIKLGIRHEEDLRYSGLTKAAKKMSKNLKAGLRNNPGAKKFIDDLYKLPIEKATSEKKSKAGSS
ncbi:NACHT domain-containing protein [Wenzhouxiangella sp. EGI_FJ10409]|uniref:NACHT domain-containing protein n=1 Tax=Wenzhouxiangella sp. EGI_FJ10409 TaxID=3243767 RepID=UPI0035DC1292